MTILVEPDARKRVSLARLNVDLADTYLARVEPDGSIVLEPAVVLSALEASLLADRQLRAEVTESIANPPPDAAAPKPPRPIRLARPQRTRDSDASVRGMVAVNPEAPVATLEALAWVEDPNGRMDAMLEPATFLMVA